MTPPEHVEHDRRALQEVVTQGYCTPYEKEYIRKDASRVPILIGAANFEDNPEEGLCFVLDLTERKKLEQQFLRSQRMESIGTLAGGIAHDLNNILSPILMSIDILKLSATDPTAITLLETIGASAKRGADIVRQVLTFARGIDGERVEVQPRYILKELENIIRDTFPKSIRLHFSIPAETWTILGDPTQIHQILLNLSVNARDAMPNGGNLTISVENCVLDQQYAGMNIDARPGRYVLISVTDTGTGIPPAIIDKIFEPFFTTKDLNKGTGLGLSTVMAIVKSHDYSEPGKGATFRVYLPAMEVSSEEQKKQTQSVGVPHGNGETILVVDDEAAALSITCKTLETFGYRTFTADNGANAVAAYAEHKNEIALVLTDIMMPVMDGSATIRALKQINPAVKIIACSGLNTNDSILKASGFGVTHFLTKPYTAGTLLKTLRTALDEA
jgi:signal transduction histidine kinase/CheY-like chemotaxis protein